MFLALELLKVCEAEACLLGYAILSDWGSVGSIPLRTQILVLEDGAWEI